MRFFATFALVLLFPMITMAQEAGPRLPGAGRILELRSDDARCPEGYRCFLAGQGGSYGEMLDRVNGDIEDPSRQISIEQFDAANPCRFIYRRSDGRMMRNGTCPDLNGTDERVTWSDFCSEHSCRRWILATTSERGATVYRVPAERVLTPGERAEEMVRELDSTEIRETVPAPAEFGDQLTELADLMEAPQPPTYLQTRDAIRSMGRALRRASEASASAATGAPETHADRQAATGDELPVTEEGLDTTDRTQPSVESGPRLDWLSWIIVALLGLVAVGLGILLYRERQRSKRMQHALNEMNAELQTALNERDEAAKRGGVLNTRLGVLNACLEQYQGTQEATPKKIEGVFALATEMKKLTRIWNGRGELNEQSLGTACAKADHYDALARAWADLVPGVEFARHPMTMHVADLQRRVSEADAVRAAFEEQFIDEDVPWTPEGMRAFGERFKGEWAELNDGLETMRELNAKQSARLKEVEGQLIEAQDQLFQLPELIGEWKESTEQLDEHLGAHLENPETVQSLLSGHALRGFLNELRERTTSMLDAMRRSLPRHPSFAELATSATSPGFTLPDPLPSQETAPYGVVHEDAKTVVRRAPVGKGSNGASHGRSPHAHTIFPMSGPPVDLSGQDEDP